MAISLSLESLAGFDRSFCDLYWFSSCVEALWVWVDFFLINKRYIILNFNIFEKRKSLIELFTIYMTVKSTRTIFLSSLLDQVQYI